ncbi:MAG: hypothetical protein ISS48_01600 [Candidatus Aenigmarchaeota archaeon]|nr:hypothetical protein [Candidatus Aenigmarchaeota archaeon]
MCPFEECKTCREYATCPFLSATVQRSYANRTLDEILKALNKINQKLDAVSNNGKN